MTYLVPERLVIGKAVRRLASPRLRAAPALPKAEGLSGLPAGPRVVLPWPPRALSPNARGHWSWRSKAAAIYRRECWALALAAGLTPAVVAGITDVAVQLDFFPPDGRHRDDDNAVAAFKAGRDGVADALQIDDRRIVTTVRLHGEARGCVVLTLTDAVDRGAVE
ncbi:MAG: hypothetical protein JO290_03360 [Sphingomonadaceae bacterium]|nr:hypothetical protein [Sphingomonadaceae bacterium]